MVFTKQSLIQAIEQEINTRSEDARDCTDDPEYKNALINEVAALHVLKDKVEQEEMLLFCDYTWLADIVASLVEQQDD